MKMPSEHGPVEAAPEFKSPLEYELPFMWGSLHVTENAHKAYGLVPLTTASLENGSNTDMPEPPKIRTDVWLVGPDEIPMAIETFPGMPLTMGATEVSVAPGGIRLVCGFDKTDEQMLDTFSLAMGEQGVDMDDVAPDEVRQTVHQQLAHQFAGMAGSNTAPHARQLLERAADETVLKKARKDFLIGVGGAAYIDVAQLLLGGRVDLVGELGGSGLIVVGSAVAYHGIRKYFKNREAVNMVIGRTARGYAGMIAEDIHRTYCARSFDHRLQEMLGPEDAQ